MLLIIIIIIINSDGFWMTTFVSDSIHLGSSPLDPMLSSPVVLHQLAVALLQLSGHPVQLLVHLGMLLIHLTQHVHLLAQILV